MKLVKLDGPGLVNEGCTHERQEYIGMEGYEETHRCLGCGETLLRYIESHGG